MTEAFESLQGAPQVGTPINNFSYAERALVREIKVRGTPGLTRKEATGRFKRVLYLEGDEQRAATTFYEANKERFEAIDFDATNNIVKRNVDREIYDWILDAAGVVSLHKYATIVVEERPDGETWVIERGIFESEPRDRYRTNRRGVLCVPPDLSLKELYEVAGGDQSEKTLEEWKDELAQWNLIGDVTMAVEYYLRDPGFDLEEV